MPFLILLLFVGIPIAEIALFIEIGGEIGVGWTLFSIFVTAILGTALVRRQGLQAMVRARMAMSENRLPVDEVLTGLCILIAAALLLTPGFLTDAVGFSLLIPPWRRALASVIVRYINRHGSFSIHRGSMNQGFNAAGQPPGQGPIIDGEFQEIEPDAPTTKEPPPLLKDKE